MKSVFLGVLALGLAATVHAQEPPAEVLLFGVFHFHNPGADVVQVDQVDVMTPANQAYLESLAARLCEFRPTKILLEFDRTREPEIQQQLAAYIVGEADSSANEIQQIGFRVARTCGVRDIHGFDETEVGWDAGPLFEYLESSAPDLLAAFNDEVAALQEADTAAHRDLSLRDLLIRTNDPEQDRVNKDLYLVTNSAGAGSSFEGADASARWWRRNFRMYANVQRYASAGERVLVVAGSGHIAILRDFLKIDRRLVADDIHRYL